VLCTAFHYLYFGSVIFWQKNIGAKAARKMLMTVTMAVNFTNILPTLVRTKVFCAAFMYLQYRFVVSHLQDIGSFFVHVLSVF